MAKVLIAEDDLLLQKMYARSLEHEGYEVMVAADGQEAFNMLDTMHQYPDVIILDVIMPKLDGLQLLRAIKEDLRLKDIPVIMLTGLSGKVSEGEAAVALGAKLYLVKGEDSPKDLNKKIKKILTEKLLR